MPIVSFIDRVDVNIISLGMLSVIVAMVIRGDDRSTLRFRLFLSVLVLTIAELLLDIANWILDGRPGSRFWNEAAYVLYFGIQPVATFLWALYADYQTFSDEKRLKKLAAILSPPVIVHTLLVLASPATGWLFNVGASNVYSRGSLFLVAAAIPFLYLAYTFFAILSHWSILPSRSRFPLLFFAVPPMLGGMLQSIIYGVTLLWPAVALSLFMVYLSIESDLLVTDHLTGLQNRRSFDRFLLRKVKYAPADRLFAVFMLDLDGFKLINDRYGHAQGDEALAETAGVLRRCMHADDFIARYAGDEFVVVADLREREGADILRGRIADSFAAFNRASGRRWKLSASIGVSVRGPGECKSAIALVDEADTMMYRDKA